MLSFSEEFSHNISSYEEKSTDYSYVPEDIKDKALRIFEVLRCPVCQNIPLKDSYTEISETMKKLIIHKLEEGWNERKIIDYFVGRYGKDILLEPENNFYFVIPFLSLFAGLGVLTFIILKSKRKNMRNE